MVVFIAVSGEKYEGSHILGVFTSHESATACALSQPTYNDGTWNAVGDNYWECGCDYVKVTEWTVTEV